VLVSWHCLLGSSSLSGVLSLCFNPGCSSGTSFLFSWPTLNSPCKHLDRAFSVVAPSIWSSLPYRFDCYQRATRLSSTSCSKLISISVVGKGAPPSRFLEGALYKFSKRMIGDQSRFVPNIGTPDWSELYAGMAWGKVEEEEEVS